MTQKEITRLRKNKVIKKFMLNIMIAIIPYLITSLNKKIPVFVQAY
ncbi:hypothetical protein [Thermoanaerobacterium thermosaccharolyticum]|jgi:hypothetical protein|uniref:Uncharacterized protein n=1 Tax=Thermoanaerobacterium thermosaccharolyticum (strain ATCC 7956 / DSM 571 / NCIMB 9385 / NCA 3814 / NCTC 13789 / WDCM 00135 / 2032) TaxID=580327 RepID=D9TQG8_THETC|nr:hypothetical protein [Thermoanaerobacterium thermosaccharolyticum]ADL69202.1 hypothetical protein Tthe_1697 [Thermoanaerobacterium thermosaccharolyticum DSM 571]